MGAGRRAAFVAASIVFGAFLLGAIVPRPAAAADTTPPTITGVWWTPRWPIHPSNVTVFANVSDDTGIQPGTVTAQWCGLGGLCTFHVMTGTGNGTYHSTDVTTLVDPNTRQPYIGAYLNVTATDLAGNLGYTGEFYSLWPDSLNVTLTPPIVRATPGAAVAVNGTAFYGPKSVRHDGENRSAPAAGVTVNVTVSGVTHAAAVDATGNFTTTFTASAVEGSYAIAASAMDRTLSGSATGTMAVSTVPKADLVIRNVRATPPNPSAGDTVTIDFDIANVGTANATNARVVVAVVLGAQQTVLLNDTVTVPAGGSVHRSVTWTAQAGDATLRIGVNPTGEIPELNLTNDVQVLALAVSPGLPLLLIAAGVGIVVVAVAIAILVRRRRKSDKPSSPEEQGKS